MAISLLDLPLEILSQIASQCPQEIRSVCRLLYVVHNDLYLHAFESDFGPGVLYTLASHDYIPVMEVVKGYDYWRGPLRKMVATWNSLPLPTSSGNVLQSQYIGDSWMLVYSLYKNRRVYLNRDDYSVEAEGSEPGLRRSSFSSVINFSKRLHLSPGLYNFSCGVILKNGSFNGLTSTQFKVTNASNGSKLLNYMAPAHLKDLVPKDKFLILDMGHFQVHKNPIQDADTPLECQSSLIPVDIAMEETIQLLKSDFIICYLDLNAYSPKQVTSEGTGANPTLIPNPDLNPRLLAWWINNETPVRENVINVPLRSMYDSLSESFTQLAAGNLPLPVSFSPGTPIPLRDYNGYNEQFYSRLNHHGEELSRSFKFLSVRDLRLSESLENPHLEKASGGPLMWKMNSAFSLSGR